MADEPYEKRAREFSLAQVNAMCVYVEAERENTTMRKLCADMWRVMSYEFASDAINDACAALGYRPSEFECSLRELGVIDEQVD